MKKVTILIGCSGSGKSTYAKEQLKLNPDLVRINRDDLRASLFNMEGYYNHIDILREREALINELTNRILNSSIFSNIIIDNTQTNLYYLKLLIEYLIYKEFEINFKFFEQPLDVCKKRVMEREGYESAKSVDYIDKQYDEYFKVKEYILKNYNGRII